MPHKKCLVTLTPEEREHLAGLLSAGKRSACYDLACTLAELAARGYEVDWSRWHTVEHNGAGRAEKKATLTVALCGDPDATTMLFAAPAVLAAPQCGQSARDCCVMHVLPKMNDQTTNQF